MLKRLLTLALTAVMCVLLALSAQAADLSLAWDMVSAPNLSGYRLYYGTASRSYPIHFDTGLVTSMRVPGLAIGQTYYFAVTALDTSGQESDYSNEVSATIADEPAPPAVRNFTGLLSGTLVRLQWEPLALPVRLYSLRSTDCTHPEQFALLTEVSPLTAQFPVQGLQTGLPYCYLARAVSATGKEGQASAVAGPFQVQLQRPSAPNNLRLISQ